jgi:hypothetical protein
MIRRSAVSHMSSSRQQPLRELAPSEDRVRARQKHLASPETGSDGVVTNSCRESVKDQHPATCHGPTMLVERDRRDRAPRRPLKLGARRLVARARQRRAPPRCGQELSTRVIGRAGRAWRLWISGRVRYLWRSWVRCLGSERGLSGRSDVWTTGHRSTRRSVRCSRTATACVATCAAAGYGWSPAST